MTGASDGIGKEYAFEVSCPNDGGFELTIAIAIYWLSLVVFTNA